MTRRFVALLLPLVLVTAACGTDGPATPEPAGPPPFANCAALTAAPVPAAAASPAATDVSPAATGPGPDSVTGKPAAGVPVALPDLALPCFTDGTPVRLDGLRGPAVINIWASWCPPCRRELPVFQRLAEQSAGALHVVGVNSRDGREPARSIGLDFGLTFPTLADPQEQLTRSLGRNALPVTLFVDGQGRVRHLDNSGALDDRTLAGLVRQHLGVVPR